MDKLYWITILDDINFVTAITLLITSIIALVSLGLYFAYDEDDEYEQEKKALAWKIAKKALIAFVIGALIGIFTPNTKEALVIYGLGGTLDYIESNDKVKELPDKCVIALEKLVDDYIENDK